MKSTGGGMGSISKRVVLSYILDWLVIIAAVGVAAALSNITPNMRPFSPMDQNISFPFTHKEKVPNLLLLGVAVLAPAVIILLVCLFFVPGPTVDRSTPRLKKWRRKFWEWNTGWLGLALALATAFLVTNGMKNLFGKPRPDLLSRCNPDLARIRDHAVGGYLGQVDEAIFLVKDSICRDRTILDDGFRSFPSGHASSSWAGLTYLTLFLCSKFAIAIPFLAPRDTRDQATYAFPHRSGHQRRANGSASYGKVPLSSDVDPSGLNQQEDDATYPIRNRAAAPPNYLLVIAVIPIGAAMYISSTRFSDFRHHGFDILFGSILGFAAGWLGFRWYHLPIRQGAGWSWGPRSRDRAFYIGVGVRGYAGEAGFTSGHNQADSAHEDLELGQRDVPIVVTGATRNDMNAPAPLVVHDGPSRIHPTQHGPRYDMSV